MQAEQRPLDPLNTQGLPARPFVDPSAHGEVDPTRYPQPKEATHKIRGRSDIIELLCGSVDQELLTVKTFYFFFYSAFGSLFPLMGVYFKQMGMNAGQCGLLIGTRPFVEFLSAPFWGSLADRWQRGKTLLLASLSAWIIFTLPIGFISPAPTGCIKNMGGPGNPIYTVSPYMVDDKSKVKDLRLLLIKNTEPKQFTEVPPEKQVPPAEGQAPPSVGQSQPTVGQSPPAVGQSPVSVEYADNYDPVKHRSWVSPIFSSIVYKVEDIKKAFFLLLLLVIIGEFFSAPAITLADSAVITLLGEDADRYGHQRMFGSLGWGLAMFFVGIALDHSTAFPEHPCGPEQQEKNYTICFATFSVLMGAALITATQINFKYEYDSPDGTVNAAPVPATVVGDFDPEVARESQLQSQLAEQLKLPNLDTGAAAPPPLMPQTKVFAQTTREIPEWVTVLKQFQSVKSASFLFVAWFMGFGIGLIFTFLFWHLQDIGGSPTLFGVASVINHISEIFAYFFSFKLITQMGHVKVLCVGLAGNVVRFLYISWLPNPWWVLPFEFVQGVTHAAVWAACCSYIAHGAPPHLRSSAQGVLQGIHHGLGRGCGAVIGGIFVSYWGTKSTFRGYGIFCLFVLGVFIFVNFYRAESGGFVSELPQTEDPRQVAEEGMVLAPHGVPSNPLPRALSSTRLSELGRQPETYGATQPTPSNPFLTADPR